MSRRRKTGDRPTGRWQDILVERVTFVCTGVGEHRHGPVALLKHVAAVPDPDYRGAGLPACGECGRAAQEFDEETWNAIRRIFGRHTRPDRVLRIDVSTGRVI